MANTTTSELSESQRVHFGHVLCDGSPVADVSIQFKDRPCYISGLDGSFEYLIPEQGYTIEKIECPGYKLVSPTLPFTGKGNDTELNILMKRDESFSQRQLRKKAEELYEKALQLEKNRQIKEAAQLYIDRSELDPDNVRWLYETGQFFFNYKGHKVAQSFYNRAIEKAKELYGEKNQWLAICYEAYGDNYFEWNVYFESGMGDENNTLHFADAKTYYQQAGHFWYTLLGEMNDHVALIYWKMGHCWKNLENGSNAMVCYEKAHNVLSSIHGECSRQVANLYSAMINFHYQQQDYQKAMEVYQKLLPIVRVMEGESSDAYKQLLQQMNYLRNELSR